MRLILGTILLLLGMRAEALDALTLDERIDKLVREQVLSQSEADKLRRKTQSLNHAPKSQRAPASVSEEEGVPSDLGKTQLQMIKVEYRIITGPPGSK